MEGVDLILFGPNGDDGLISEHQQDQWRQQAKKEADDRTQKKWTRICAFFGVLPVILKILEYAHIIK